MVATGTPCDWSETVFFFGHCVARIQRRISSIADGGARNVNARIAAFSVAGAAAAKADVEVSTMPSTLAAVFRGWHMAVP
jgi:hypothetical protein